LENAMPFHAAYRLGQATAQIRQGVEGLAGNSQNARRQYQTPCTPRITAISEISRPIPENNATETNWALELSDAEDSGTNGEMRATLGMTILQFLGFKNPTFREVLAATTKVQCVEAGAIKYVSRTKRPASEPTKVFVGSRWPDSIMSD
jgi:hypothetical protein